MFRWNKRVVKQDRCVQKNRKFRFFSKMAITACVGLSLTFTTVSAAENLETIYHVYVDGEHVGEVNDKDIVQDVIDAKIADSKDMYGDATLTIGEEISYIPEKVFNPEFNNNEVTKIMEEKLSVMVQAVELKIGDNIVGYFNGQQAVEQVIKKYMSKYVDKKELEKLEVAKGKNNDALGSIDIADNPNNKTKLSVGDSVIVDVAFSDHVSFSNQKAKPADLLSVEQGVKMLEKGTLAEKKHKVQTGEVLGKIASKYDLTTKKLLELNPSLSEDGLLQIDQEINVTEYKPFVDVVVKKEEKKEEKIAFKTEVIESDELYKGDEKVKQEGKDGKKQVHYSIVLKNGKVAEKEVLDEQVTKEVENKIIIKGTKVIPSRGTGKLSWPAVGGYISSHMGQRWGKMHKGIDIAGPSNRNILAADNGVVVSAGYDNGGYGNKIVINHNNGMKTIYAHLSSISVQAGQTVEKGSKIGVMGSTGHSTGVHLHFEVYVNGALKNPMSYLNK